MGIPNLVAKKCGYGRRDIFDLCSHSWHTVSKTLGISGVGAIGVSFVIHNKLLLGTSEFMLMRGLNIKSVVGLVTKKTEWLDRPPERGVEGWRLSPVKSLEQQDLRSFWEGKHAHTEGLGDRKAGESLAQTSHRWPHTSVLLGGF